jgi:hypothetical protein
MNDRDEWSDESLDGALADAVRALPREAEPAADIEERTVKLLRGRGQLGRVRRAIGPAWWAAGLAASIALFASGLVAGQWLGTRQTAAVVAAQQQASLEEIAAAVERTGGEYVSALARLAESDVQNGGGEQARQVALRVLHQAANEVVRLAPNEPVAVKILQGFDHAALQAAPAGSAPRRRQIIWY